MSLLQQKGTCYFFRGGSEYLARPQLLRGARLWYVSPTQQHYGLVDGDADLVTTIAKAPVVQPEQVDALRLRLQDMPAARPLPLPDVRKPPEIFVGAAVPVLQLRVVPYPIGRSKATMPMGCARLAFDYGEVRLPHDEPSPSPRRLLV